MVRRLVFTCVVNDRRPSLQCTPLATTSGSGRVCELFPSCQGQRSRLPGKGSYASTKFSRRTRQAQGRCKQLLRANGLAGDPTHPGFTSRIILSGKRSEKTLELRARLMRHKDANLRRWLPKSSSVSAVFVYRNQSTYLRLDRALLMRHKDANLHLAKKCGTGFQKATSLMSLYNCFYRET